jgi:hypothetical protein
MTNNVRSETFLSPLLFESAEDTSDYSCLYLSIFKVSQLNDMKAFGKLVYETYIVEAKNLVTPVKQIPFIEYKIDNSFHYFFRKFGSTI